MARIPFELKGKTAEFKGTLKRLVDTTGWVSADFHNHSTPSGDNTCGTDDRIINLAAEQIEFAPTTEHNRLYDWRPHIERLKLTEELNTVSGVELTGQGPHMNAFPFQPVLELALEQVGFASLAFDKDVFSLHHAFFGRNCLYALAFLTEPGHGMPGRLAHHAAFLNVRSKTRFLAAREFPQ